NVAYRLTGNDDDAFDLVQEALLRVRKGLETYTPGSMEGWLSRIVTNVFLDEVRRKRRRPIEVLPEDTERLLPSAPGADEPAARHEAEAHLATCADCRAELEEVAAARRAIRIMPVHAARRPLVGDDPFGADAGPIGAIRPAPSRRRRAVWALAAAVAAAIALLLPPD